MSFRRWLLLRKYPLSWENDRFDYQGTEKPALRIIGSSPLLLQAYQIKRLSLVLFCVIWTANLIHISGNSWMGENGNENSNNDEDHRHHWKKKEGPCRGEASASFPEQSRTHVWEAAVGRVLVSQCFSSQNFPLAHVKAATQSPKTPQSSSPALQHCSVICRQVQ